MAANQGHILVHSSSLGGTARLLMEVLLTSKPNPTSPHPFKGSHRKVWGSRSTEVRIGPSARKASTKLHEILIPLTPCHLWTAQALGLGQT